MATKKNLSTSVADCFHFKYNINKLLCLALNSKLRSAQINLTRLSNDNTCKGTIIEIADSEYAAIQFHTDLYVESMANISQVLHPYTAGNKAQSQESATLQIEAALSNIEQIIEECKIKDTYNLFAKSQNQLTDVTCVISLWHDFLAEELQLLEVSTQVKKWFTDFLLPKTYWEQALKKTKYSVQRNYIKQQILICNSVDFQLCETISEHEYERLKDKALFLSIKFQRSSSQVEGRNGYLSQINHNQRSFDDTRLEVLTVIHNFDTRGIDNKTPAERLFGNKMNFEALFEFIIDNIHELPRPRKRNIKC